MVSAAEKRARDTNHFQTARLIRMTIYKFGGGTTHTLSGLEKIVKLIAEQFEAERQRPSGEPAGLVVVVSAIGHTTRTLRRAGALAEASELVEAAEQLSRLWTLHTQLLKQLRLSDELKSKVDRKFKSIDAAITKLIDGIAITRQMSRRSRDQLLAQGEELALALLSAYFASKGLPVSTVDARSCIITNDQYGRAEPILSETDVRIRKKLSAALKKRSLVLIQGFVGATLDGITTTMGSESSDLTATLIARSLQAEEVVIWKSVSGIFTADPEVVPNAMRLPALSFEEADEIGRRGARVLFQRIAKPLESFPNACSLRVGSPSSRRKSTLIGAASGAALSEYGVLSLALEPSVERISIPLSHLRERKRDMDQLRKILREHGVIAWESENELRVALTRDSKKYIVRMLGQIRANHSEHPRVSILSAVLRADGDAESPLLRTTLLTALRDHGILEVITLEHSILFFLSTQTPDAALRSAHSRVFGV